MRPRRRGRRAAALAAALVAGWWLAGFAAAWTITMPHPGAIPAWSELDGHPIEPVATTTPDGTALAGWLVAAGDRRTAVVLAAGIRGNRLAMVQRARWYVARGITALLVDLRGTGQSDAVRITMGYAEAFDLLAWHALLQARGYTAIGAHGQSLGAAAVVFTAERPLPPRWAFVVLEACYRDIDAALAARLPWLPAWLAWTAWPLHTCAGWLTGVARSDLVPLRAIERLAAPTLLACGSDDTKVGPDATARLFAASPAVPKRRVDVPGTGHTDLWRAGPTLPRALGAWLTELGH
ncbi:MAG: alpha/beta hydrolase [Planctomycetes bacterium]|nr:alpha/beta hydrolase [Planctomycetota bacterium]